MARMMPCSTPTQTTTAAVAAATANSSLRSRQIWRIFSEVDELETDQEDDGRENRVRQVLQRLRQEEEDDRDDEGGRQLRHLRSTLGLVDHLGLGWAAVDDEGARQAGCQVGSAETDEIVVLDEPLLVLDGIGPRRRGTLGEDDEKHRDRGGDQPGRVTPGNSLREADVRQTARHVPERRHAVRAQIEDPAHRDRSYDGHETAWYRLDPALEHDQDRQHGQRHGKGRTRHLTELLQRVPELDHGPAGPARVDLGGGDAEHAGKLTHRDLDADACQKADEHGA